MKIKSMKAKFGWVKVNGDKYKKDIVIHSDGSITKREKKKSKDLKVTYGHTPLSERELDFLRRNNSTPSTLEQDTNLPCPLRLKRT